MKYEIEIPDLPEGWEAVAYRYVKNGDDVLLGKQIVSWLHKDLSTGSRYLIVRKKQMRRIVLEGTGQVRKPMEGEYVQNNGNYCLCRKPERWENEHEIWKIVEDNKK